MGSAGDKHSSRRYAPQGTQSSCRIKMNLGGTFLVVQWLRLRTSNARGMSLIPGRGNKIPQPMWCPTLVEEGNLSGDGSVFQNLVLSKTRLC